MIVLQFLLGDDWHFFGFLILLGLTYLFLADLIDRLGWLLFIRKHPDRYRAYEDSQPQEPE